MLYKQILIFNTCPHYCIFWEVYFRSYLRPQVFCGVGEKGYLFSGSLGALVIIFGELGEQGHNFEDLGSPAQK